MSYCVDGVSESTAASAYLITTFSFYFRFSVRAKFLSLMVLTKLRPHSHCLRNVSLGVFPFCRASCGRSLPGVLSASSGGLAQDRDDDTERSDQGELAGGENQLDQAIQLFIKS